MDCICRLISVPSAAFKFVTYSYFAVRCYQIEVRNDLFSVVQHPTSSLIRLVVEVVNHTQLDTHTHTYTAGRTPLKKWSACGIGLYLHNTQQTQGMNSHTLSGIVTRDPTNRAAADLRSRPRQIFLNGVLNIKKCPLKEHYGAQRRNSVYFFEYRGKCTNNVYTFKMSVVGLIAWK